MTHKLDLDRIAFIGRTYSEYMDIFNLDEALLADGPVLDCAAGPSSFTAEARKKGFDVQACDVMYGERPFDLFKKGEADIRHVFSKFDEVAHQYEWDYYTDKEYVTDLRRKALGGFIKDFGRNKHRGLYTQATLPYLPYFDNAFSLVLTGHFLFLYGDRMDLDLHFRCLEELIRVSADEVRIFPILGLDAKPYKHLEDIISFLETEEVDAEVVKVPFEFQIGGNNMLKIKQR